MFRKLIRERRCLIPANCYYEWKQSKIGKRPYCIRMEDESLFWTPSPFLVSWLQITFDSGRRDHVAFPPKCINVA